MFISEGIDPDVDVPPLVGINLLNGDDYSSLPPQLIKGVPFPFTEIHVGFLLKVSAGIEPVLDVVTIKPLEGEETKVKFPAGIVVFLPIRSVGPVVNSHRSNVAISCD